MAATALAQTCASCVFGAIDSQTLSFTQHVLETITVSVIPHITVFANGSAPSTSYESITITQEIVSPTGTGTVASTPATYTDEADITWTVGDATLTYPTTYIQYLAFGGAPATSVNGQTCAQQTDASSVSLPTSVDTASLIYPVSNATAGMALPSPLLEYLGGFAALSSQFYGEALTGCAALTDPSAVGTPVAISIPSTSTLPSFSLLSSTPSALRKRFEGPRRAGPQEPIVTPADQYRNDTLHRRQDASGTAVGTGTEPVNYSSESASVSDVTSEATPIGGHLSTTATATALETATHTTAYVLSAVSELVSRIMCVR